uniref:Uncharacterized protein n=1 Tax=Arundo donax TaxID=35708 RepID=A0A0A9CXX8_ARUDO
MQVGSIQLKISSGFLLGISKGYEAFWAAACQIRCGRALLSMRRLVF